MKRQARRTKAAPDCRVNKGRSPESQRKGGSREPFQARFSGISGRICNRFRLDLAAFAVMLVLKSSTWALHVAPTIPIIGKGPPPWHFLFKKQYVIPLPAGSTDSGQRHFMQGPQNE
jgi:hypothetical protein